MNLIAEFSSENSRLVELLKFIYRKLANIPARVPARALTMVDWVDFAGARSLEIASATLKVVGPVETVAGSLAHKLTSVSILDSRNVSTSYQHGILVLV